MYSKYNEIESLIEDLVDNVIVENIAENVANKKECCIALDMLIDKLTELECGVFKDYFDN